MIEPDPPKNIDAIGMVDGDIKVLSPEEYRQAVIKRNAEEAVGDEGDEDISDLGEIEALFDED